MIPIKDKYKKKTFVVGSPKTIPKGFEKRLEELKPRGIIETI